MFENYKTETQGPNYHKYSGAHNWSDDISSMLTLELLITQLKYYTQGAKI